MGNEPQSRNPASRAQPTKRLYPYLYLFTSYLGNRKSMITGAVYASGWRTNLLMNECDVLCSCSFVEGWRRLLRRQLASRGRF